MTFTSDNLPVLVIIGPSGTGKSTALHELSRKELVEIVPTWTTRPQRRGQQEDTLGHKFVSEAEFRRAYEAGTLLGAKQMFGLRYWYGVPKISAPVEPDCVPVVVLRAGVVGQFRKYYPNCIVYQVADSLPRVRLRLEARQLLGEDIGSRLKDYAKELELGDMVAKRTFMNDGTAEELAHKLARAIHADFISVK